MAIFRRFEAFLGLLGCLEGIRTSNNLFLPLILSVPSLKFYDESKSDKKNFDFWLLDP